MHCNTDTNLSSQHFELPELTSALAQALNWCSTKPELRVLSSQLISCWDQTQHRGELTSAPIRENLL